MRSDGAAADVLIIGGGFSGVTLAAQLKRRGLTPVIVEGSQRAGRGTAFSTPEQVHLLNVPAARMSAWPDQAEHFAKAVAVEGHEAGAFVPRGRFGDYLSAILEEAGTDVIEQDAVRAEPAGSGWAVTLADGSRIEGGALALAIGNQPPGPLPQAEGISPELFVNDPWSEQGRDAVRLVAETGGDVLIVGTGLTMVDVVLSLDAAGHRGHIVAVSRRGLAPHVHAPHEVTPIGLDKLPQGSLLQLWRWLKRRSHSVGWRAAVDSLRPHSHALWRALGEEQQRRFLRHARPWWDVRRHRIAPQVAAVIARLAGEGRLEIVAGRIFEMRAAEGRLNAAILPRGEAYAKVQTFALGVNCTGPLGQISASGDGLLKGLFDAGLARPDSHDLGIAVDGRSRFAERAWALGPLTKGSFWEITAVPDIRGQVAAVADDIAEELKQ